MLTEQQQAQLDWEKTDGLLPVVVQHAVSGEVLMLGYMNQDALTKTIDSGKVTFFLAYQTTLVDQRGNLWPFP